MKNPFVRWACGIFAILGLPLGVITTMESGSPLAGLVSAVTVVVVGLLVCHKEIVRDYKENRRPRQKNSGHVYRYSRFNRHFFLLPKIPVRGFPGTFVGDILHSRACDKGINCARGS